MTHLVLSTSTMTSLGYTTHLTHQMFSTLNMTSPEYTTNFTRSVNIFNLKSNAYTSKSHKAQCFNIKYDIAQIHNSHTLTSSAAYFKHHDFHRLHTDHVPSNWFSYIVLVMPIIMTKFCITNIYSLLTLTHPTQLYISSKPILQMSFVAVKFKKNSYLHFSANTITQQHQCILQAMLTYIIQTLLNIFFAQCMGRYSKVKGDIVKLRKIQ